MTIPSAGRAFVAAALMVWLGSDLIHGQAAAQSAGAGADRHVEARRTVRDPEPLLALLRRLKDDPPPLTDAGRMRDWTARYGKATYDNDSGCQRGAMWMSPASLPGVGMLSTTLRHSCERGVRHSMLLLTFEDRSALEEPARATLTEMFGAAGTVCEATARTSWAAGDSLTVSIVSPFYPSFAIMVLNRPLADLDC